MSREIERSEDGEVNCGEDEDFERGEDVIKFDEVNETGRREEDEMSETQLRSVK